VPYHPLHDQGYPSVGDVHSTVPVPKEKWFTYAGERSGRFQVGAAGRLVAGAAASGPG
jgi:phosphoadenosine phosphosulfate reductase